MTEAPMTAFGYELEIERVEGRSSPLWSVNVPAFPDISVQKSDKKGRVVRDAWEEIEEKLIELEAADEEPPPTTNEGLHQDDVLKRVHPINRELVKIGFYVSPMELTHDEIMPLKELAKEIASLPDEKLTYGNQLEALEDRALQVLWQHVFNADNRAKFMETLWMNSPTLSKLSHVVEEANTCLFQGLTIAAVQTLTPVIEGTLLRWYGYDPQTDGSSPGPGQLLNHMAAQNHQGPTMVHPLFTYEHMWCFEQIFENLFWSDFGGAADRGFFGRGYSSHLPGTGPFYRAPNALRLVLLSDLLAQVVAACDAAHEAFTMDHERRRERREYYLRLTDEGIARTDDRIPLLEEHENMTFDGDEGGTDGYTAGHDWVTLSPPS